jgi:hypothetical protein
MERIPDLRTGELKLPAQKVKKQLPAQPSGKKFTQ